MSFKLVFIGSTGGAVLSRLLEHNYIRSMTYEVVSDRECGFLDVGSRHYIHSIQIPCSNGAQFSDALYARYRNIRKIIFVSFYTRMFSGDFVKFNNGFIFNSHPSLLPSFKGMHGFEDTINSSALFMGCSFHKVDNGMDTGECVIQAALPLNRSLSEETNRHKIFIAQYYCLLQFTKWIHDKRLEIDVSGKVSISNLTYDLGCFSPGLDDDFFSFHRLTNELS